MLLLLGFLIILSIIVILMAFCINKCITLEILTLGAFSIIFLAFFYALIIIKFYINADKCKPKKITMTETARFNSFIKDKCIR